MAMNGDALELRAGAYTATIGTVGAALAALRHDGRDLVLPVDPAAAPDPAYRGQILAPWPNRIPGGRWSWAGADLRLPINDPEYQAALHGLVTDTCWRVEQRAADAVRLGVDLAASPGYPFELAISVEYRLDERGLQVGIEGANRGPVEAPWGCGAHPYLTVPGPMVGWTLQIPAARVLRDGTPALPSELDLRTDRPLGERRVDDAYTGLPTPWTARLSGADGEVVELTAATPWVQVYTGERVDRAGVAVEPMTCPPGAFATGVDLIRLAPGGRHRTAFTIAAG